MPTNGLLHQAADLLAQAVRLHEAGRNADAHKLTMQAAECLEDAVSIEGFRLRANRQSSPVAEPVPPSTLYWTDVMRQAKKPWGH